MCSTEELTKIYNGGSKIRTRINTEKAATEQLLQNYDRVQQLLIGATERDKKKIQKTNKNTLDEWQKHNTTKKPKPSPLTLAQFDCGEAVHLYCERHQIKSQQQKQEAKIAAEGTKKRLKESAAAEAAAKKQKLKEDRMKEREEKKAAEKEGKLQTLNKSLFEQAQERKKLKQESSQQLKEDVNRMALVVLTGSVNKDPQLQALQQQLFPKQPATEEAEEDEQDEEDKEN